jgi:cell division protein FtsI (penicillin-binding protein 3)
MSATTQRQSKGTDPARAQVRRRQVLLLGLVLGALAVTYRAFELQVLDAKEWRAQAEAQQADQVDLPAPRGTIYDRDGVPLAASEETFRISVAGREVKDRTQLAALLQKHTNLSRADAKRAVHVNSKWFVVPGRHPATTRQALNGIRGVYFERLLWRFYPRGNIANELIGPVTAQGDAVGGIELEFDSVLVGQPGRAILRRDAADRPLPGALQEVLAPVSGRDIVLTIDADLQEIAREALAHALRQTGAVSGEIVMADPHTGEVLAAVSSKPGGRSWRAVTEPYEPGSTLKPFIVATLLAEKKAELADSVFAENGEYTPPGRNRPIKDVHGYGWLTIADALKHSSNVVMAKLAERLDAETQYSYLRGFGFGSPTAITYPSESGGRLRRPENWSKLSSASLAIGYEISVTPLQLLMAYGALANGGVLMQPRLVREVHTREGKTAQAFEEQPVRRVIPERIADELRGVLTDVVVDGTARAASVGPFEVAGKTGTARSFANGQYKRGAYTSSFAGFFPANNPQIVFLVKLDSPVGDYYGGLTAAPVTRATLEAALAALSTPLDKRAVAVAAPPPLAIAESYVSTVANQPESGPFVFAMESGPVRRQPAPLDDNQALVPEVRGLPLRDAVRALHGSGFRVRVNGQGPVGSVEPEVGSTLPKGALIRISTLEQR